MNFAPGLGIIVLIITILLPILKTVLIVFLCYYFSQLFTPVMARQLKYEHKLTGSSLYDVFTFQLTWLLVSALVIGVSDILFFKALSLIKDSYSGSFPAYVNYCLFSLTLWYYDQELKEFELKSFRIALIQWGWYIAIIVVASILRFNGSSFGWMLSGISYPVITVILTIYLISRNQRSSIGYDSSVQAVDSETQTIDSEE
ncbi:hypothetical protein QNI19_38550 [Cytophagaceae bacterium DM2B3-1]|uniref:Uncharacterized protein n=1 Tax=Xanthocytophaga flava TaxID=3048013 RepID=A0ABT7D146_9BACT|nr:hypothetical protein [Xanthocytophaga flavus]MDJ1498892.1 hypothetical protein [Xanthocytophaga flavus]